MSVQHKHLSADPADLLTEKARAFICSSVAVNKSEYLALHDLLECDPEAWLMLDDPRILHTLAEHFVEKYQPRLAYYSLLRNQLCHADIAYAGIPMYLSCLLEAAPDVGNPFIGDEHLAISIQKDRQRCAISPPDLKRRLQQKTAHLCTLVMVLYRHSLSRDQADQGPNIEFYHRHAIDSYYKLSNTWLADGEKDLAKACKLIAEDFDIITKEASKATRSGLIAPPV